MALGTSWKRAGTGNGQALEIAGLCPINEYITCGQNTIVQYVVQWPVVSIVWDKKHPPRIQRILWWDQEGLIFEEMEAELDLDK